MLPVKPRWRPGHVVKHKGEVCEIVAGPYSEGTFWAYQLVPNGRLIRAAELEPHDRFFTFEAEDWERWIARYSTGAKREAVANLIDEAVANFASEADCQHYLAQLDEAWGERHEPAGDEAEPAETLEVADHLVQPTDAYAAFVRLNKHIEGRPAYLLRLDHGPKRSESELLDLETLHPFGFMIMSEAQLTQLAESALAVLTAETVEA